MLLPADGVLGDVWISMKKVIAKVNLRHTQISLYYLKRQSCSYEKGFIQESGPSWRDPSCVSRDRGWARGMKSFP
jgi:hypothetical protein